MATTTANVGASSWFGTKHHQKNRKKNKFRIHCSYVTDPYKTLKINPGASEPEVKKAFRKLALQYHPDVCRGSNCGVQFSLINEAYDTVMKRLRETNDANTYETYSRAYDQEIDEPFRGMNDPDWELWEEWMGWEGAGVRDYSAFINPHI